MKILRSAADLALAVVAGVLLIPFALFMTNEQVDYDA